MRMRGESEQVHAKPHRPFSQSSGKVTYWMNYCSLKGLHVETLGQKGCRTQRCVWSAIFSHGFKLNSTEKTEKERWWWPERSSLISLIVSLYTHAQTQMAVKASQATEMNVWWNESWNLDKRPQGLGYVFRISGHKWTPVFILHAMKNIRTLSTCAGFRYNTHLIIDVVFWGTTNTSCVSKRAPLSRETVIKKALGQRDTRSSLRQDCVLWQPVL